MQTVVATNTLPQRAWCSERAHGREHEYVCGGGAGREPGRVRVCSEGTGWKREGLGMRGRDDECATVAGGRRCTWRGSGGCQRKKGPPPWALMPPPATRWPSDSAGLQRHLSPPPAFLGPALKPVLKTPLRKVRFVQSPDK